VTEVIGDAFHGSPPLNFEGSFSDGAAIGSDSDNRRKLHQKYRAREFSHRRGLDSTIESKLEPEREEPAGVTCLGAGDA
jgi:hypothetical protein